MDVPGPRALELFGVDVVGGDGRAGYVGEEVEQQDLTGEQRQERQEGGGHRHREHVAEVGAGGDPDVLEGVGEGSPAEPDAVGDHVEALVQQHDGGGLFGDVDGGVDRDPDVGRVEGGGVVDAVAEEPDGLISGS